MFHYTTINISKTIKMQQCIDSMTPCCMIIIITINTSCILYTILDPLCVWYKQQTATTFPLLSTMLLRYQKRSGFTNRIHSTTMYFAIDNNFYDFQKVVNTSVCQYLISKYYSINNFKRLHARCSFDSSIPHIIHL